MDDFQETEKQINSVQYSMLFRRKRKSLQLKKSMMNTDVNDKVGIVNVRQK